MYTIDGKKFFVFGGASSHDKEHRTEGKNWWKEEIPTEEEYKKAKESICNHNYTCDYIITHCAPSSIQKLMGTKYEPDELTEFLETIKNNVIYKKWFFGHYHQDKSIDEKNIAVFNSFYKILE